MSRFVSVDTVRLDLSHGDWIEVKRQLSYGDIQAVASKTRGDFTAGELYFVAAALVDWSLVDEQDKRVDIDEEPARIAALKALKPSDFAEIDAAISKHFEAVNAEKKDKAPRGQKKSGRISDSAA
jgi:hypothetical protein